MTTIIITSNVWLLKQRQQDVQSCLVQLIWSTATLLCLSEKPTPGHVHLEAYSTNRSCLVVIHHRIETLKSVNNLSVPDKAFSYIMLNETDVPVSFFSLLLRHVEFTRCIKELQAVFAVSLP